MANTPIENSGTMNSDAAPDGAARAVTAEIQEFGKRLAELEVIDESGFRTACMTSGGNTFDLVESLEKTGKLTPYQAEQIREGSVDKIRFDDYVLLDKLGEGGMGAVFKGRNLMLGRVEAIKTIRSGVNQSEALLKRFQQEARVLARLEHPAIVPIYKVGRYGDSDYIAMKYVEGEDLKAKVENALKRNQLIPVSTACQWVLETADALHHAHQHNVIHRDIKPGNLMVGKNGKIIVLDMGIARLADPAGGANPGGGLTIQSRGMGTPDFMPAEQWADATAVTPASDIYALGCTFFYLLTGQTPYGKRPLVDLMKAHTKEPIPSIRDLRADVPPEVDAIIKRMLAKTTKERISSGLEVVEALAPFAVPESGQRDGTNIVRDGTATPRAGTPTPLPDVEPKRKRTAKSREGTITREPAEPAARAATGATNARASSRWSTERSFGAPRDETDREPVKKQTTPKKSGPSMLVPAIAFLLLIASAAGVGVFLFLTPSPEPSPKDRWTARFNEFLVDHQRENPAIWPTIDALKIEMANLTTSVIDSEEVFNGATEKVKAVTNERKSLASSGMPTPVWLVEFQKKNSQEWPKLDELRQTVLDKLNGGSLDLGQGLLGPGGPIDQATLERRRKRLAQEAMTWLTGYQRDNKDLWPSLEQLQQVAADHAVLDRLNSNADFEELKRKIEAETELVRNPFDKLNIRAAAGGNEQNEVDAQAAARVLPEIIGLHAMPMDTAWKFTGNFADDKGNSLKQVHVDEPFYIEFTSDRPVFVTPVQVEDGTVFIAKINKEWSAKDTGHLLNKMFFNTPGVKRMFLYATDRPVVAESVLLNLDNQKQFAKMFSRPWIAERVEKSIEQGTKLPGVPPNRLAGKWTRVMIEIRVEP